MREHSNTKPPAQVIQFPQTPPRNAQPVATNKFLSSFLDTKDVFDLNHLVIHPDATRFVRVRGHAMQLAGILDSDVLIVDLSLKAEPGSVVMAEQSGELLCKRVGMRQGELVLMNEWYGAECVQPASDFTIYGGVLYSIHAIEDRAGVNE